VVELRRTAEEQSSVHIQQGSVFREVRNGPSACITASTGEWGYRLFML